MVPMHQMLRILLAAFLILLLDIPWLLLQGETFQKTVLSIQGSPMRFKAWAAIPVYLALAYLLVQQTSLTSSVLTGICVYAVYDFTTLSIFNNYPLEVAILDTLWGGVLFGLGYLILKK